LVRKNPNIEQSSWEFQSNRSGKGLAHGRHMMSLKQRSARWVAKAGIIGLLIESWSHPQILSTAFEWTREAMFSWTMHAVFSHLLNL